MITIIAGPRTWGIIPDALRDQAREVRAREATKELRLLLHELDRQHSRRPMTEVVTGGAHGVDTLAHHWALDEGIRTRVFPADWKRHGRAAGPIRNRAMAEYAAPGGCLIAVSRCTPGTNNMIEQARAVGLRVVLI